jgi:hypothetical protein
VSGGKRFPQRPQQEIDVRNTLLASLVLAALPSFFAAAVAAEPAPTKATECPWPAAQDAVQAAPQNHLVIFENDKVRVLDVIVPPHTKEPIHAHCWPSVLYITDAGKYIDYRSDGKILFDSRSIAAPPSLPMTMWKEPEAPHAVENLDDKPLHLIRVELKPQAP